jgi:hypothetical protein
MFTSTIKLEPSPIPENPPKHMAGSALTPDQSKALIKFFKDNNIVTLPDNKSADSLVFINLQADTTFGGFINTGYN